MNNTRKTSVCSEVCGGSDLSPVEVSQFSFAKSIKYLAVGKQLCAVSVWRQTIASTT